MDYKNLFEKFNEEGRLVLPNVRVVFGDIAWYEHPCFEGVELKNIVTAENTNGLFSFHIVRIAPNKRIGLHIHEKQTETHEVIAGEGICINNGVELHYEAGTVSVFPMKIPHEVIAGENGLYLFAKFIPALC